jgi:hypothetical protein
MNELLTTIIGNAILLTIIVGPLLPLIALAFLGGESKEASAEVKRKIKEHNFINYSKEYNDFKIKAAKQRAKII